MDVPKLVLNHFGRPGKFFISAKWVAEISAVFISLEILSELKGTLFTQVIYQGTANDDSGHSPRCLRRRATRRASPFSAARDNVSGFRYDGRTFLVRDSVR